MTTWLRVASLGIAAGLWLHGQGEVSDLDEFSPAPLGQDIAAPFAAAVGLCGHWWFLSWLTRRRLCRTGWRATRVVWPTAAVALVWLAVIAGLSIASEAVAATLATVLAIVNLPLIPVVVCLAGLLSGLDLPWWILVPAGTAAAWFCWWAIIVFFERRARNAGPVTLGTHLTS